MIPVDTTKFQPLATGIVQAHHDWVKGENGKNRKSEVQSIDEATGMPVWEIECLRVVTSFGVDSTQAVMVSVPSPTQPVVPQLKPVVFRGLVVDFYASRGRVAESWSAEGIGRDEPAKSSQG